MIGLNNFILIYKIDDISDYISNHYEIYDPCSIKNKNIREIGTVAANTYNITKYNIYVINENVDLIKKNHLFIPENKQIIILLNNNISQEAMVFPIIKKRIIKYVSTRTDEFLSVVKNSFYQNLELKGYELDPLP